MRCTTALWASIMLMAALPNATLAQTATAIHVGNKITTVHTGTYHAEGKRDPFYPPEAWLARAFPDTPATLGETMDKTPGKIVRKKEFLETFQLDSIKLVAILFKVEGATPVAMVEDPEGRGHLIRAGNHIGVHEGQVSQIRDGEIIIVEPLPGRHDTTTTRTITLRLHQEQEQGQGQGHAHTQKQ